MNKILLSILLVMLAIPVLAFEVPISEDSKFDIYGQARFSAWYNNNNDKSIEGEFNTLMQGNSRFGIKLTIGNLIGNVETNFTQDGAGGIGFRQLWSGYKFNNGLTLKLGQMTTLTGNSSVFQNVFGTDNGLNGFGAIGDTRRPQIQLHYMGFGLSVVTTNRDNTGVEVEDASASVSKGADYMPRVELVYNININKMLTGKVFGTYGLFTEKQNNLYNNINAWHAGFLLKPKFNDLYFILAAFYGQNIGMYAGQKTFGNNNNAIQTLPRPTLKPLDSNGKVAGVNNIATYGGSAAVGYSILSNLNLELGGGYQQTTFEKKGLYDTSSYAVYISGKYSLNKYIIITPEIAYFVGDSKQVSYDGNALLAGLQLMLVF